MTDILCDYRVNQGIRSRLLLMIYRFGNMVHYRLRIPVVRPLLWAIYRTIDFAVVNVLFNAEIPGQARIGPRLRLPHGGRGVVIHPAVEIGADVTIFHQVTIGVRGPDLVGLAPTIGDRVFIGVGAKVLGHLHVGEDARVGANAVVVKDISSGRTAVGIPASVWVKQVQEPKTTE